MRGRVVSELLLAHARVFRRAEYASACGLWSSFGLSRVGWLGSAFNFVPMVEEDYVQEYLSVSYDDKDDAMALGATAKAEREEQLRREQEEYASGEQAKREERRRRKRRRSDEQARQEEEERRKRYASGEQEKEERKRQRERYTSGEQEKEERKRQREREE